MRRCLFLALGLLTAGCDIPIPSGVPTLIDGATTSQTSPSRASSAQDASLSGETALAPIIAQIAGQDGLAQGMVKAVVEQESGFNSLAVSGAGAEGLMQLMPGTIADINRAGAVDVLDPFDAAQNLAGGCWYLKWIHGALPQSQIATGEDWKLSLAAYNGGIGRVETAIAQALAGAPRNPRVRWQDVADNLPGETQRYVPAVMALWTKFGP